jgi:hypothetical protein
LGRAEPAASKSAATAESAAFSFSSSAASSNSNTVGELARFRFFVFI